MTRQVLFEPLEGRRLLHAPPGAPAPPAAPSALPVEPPAVPVDPLPADALGDGLRTDFADGILYVAIPRRMALPAGA